MSNDPRPRAASPVPVTPPDVEGARLRKRSMIGVGLFVPASLLAGILVLTRENAARCLSYGEACDGTPGLLYVVALVIVVAALVTVQSSSRPEVRRAAFWTQLGAEGVFLLFLLTAFA
ncbi:MULTISPECIES: hypothetical protein [unclassified Streptomyces]|uniref:hypothetical protein n=1 Tax=unclassified Streptomyces TaxID=2593676 RepID=UPI0006F637B0|nr:MULTISPECIES: hypothetical protein [unclassified Streptomyces]KQX52827.1 hypothetical protein ASD33_06110 [Streptomyces sp. Root1304]KRA89742.1 hypothetical protein ASE09_06115 [Streptomyces sp. Root66D1]